MNKWIRLTCEVYVRKSLQFVDLAREVRNVNEPYFFKFVFAREARELVCILKKNIKKKKMQFYTISPLVHKF